MYVRKGERATYVKVLLDDLHLEVVSDLSVGYVVGQELEGLARVEVHILLPIDSLVIYLR